MSKRNFTPAESAFIQDVASLLAPWGLPPTAGRLYAYLLLSDAPASLDRIAADLDMSKTGAWNAAKMLESYGNARRYGEPGSKRALYGPSEDFGAALLKQSALLGAMGQLLRNSTTTAASQNAALRLDDMARFYLAMREAMDTAIHRLSARKEEERQRA